MVMPSTVAVVLCRSYLILSSWSARPGPLKWYLVCFLPDSKWILNNMCQWIYPDAAATGTQGSKVRGRAPAAGCWFSMAVDTLAFALIKRCDLLIPEQHHTDIQANSLPFTKQTLYHWSTSWWWVITDVILTHSWPGSPRLDDSQRRYLLSGCRRH